MLDFVKLEKIYNIVICKFFFGCFGKCILIRIYSVNICLLDIRVLVLFVSFKILYVKLILEKLNYFFGEELIDIS